MFKVARDVMTPDPACCTPNMTIDQVARLMAHNDCGEIPIVDATDQPVGVITDRDIVCRVVADGKNPVGYTVGEFMTRPVVTVRQDAPLDVIVSTMERHRIRRVPVVNDEGSLVGIIAQADVAQKAGEHEVAELVREVSKHVGH